MWNRFTAYVALTALIVFVLLVVSIVLKSREDIKNRYGSEFFDSGDIHLMKVEFSGMSFSSNNLLTIDYRVGEIKSAKDRDYKWLTDARWNLIPFGVEENLAGGALSP